MNRYELNSKLIEILKTHCKKDVYNNELEFLFNHITSMYASCEIYKIAALEKKFYSLDYSCLIPSFNFIIVENTNCLSYCDIIHDDQLKSYIEKVSAPFYAWSITPVFKNINSIWEFELNYLGKYNNADELLNK